MKISKAKKLLACFMAVLVLMTSFSISIASAETDGTFNYSFYNEYDENYNATKCVRIIGYVGNDTEVIIPETIADCPVTTVYDRAFAENKTITSVTIPESVKEIGMFAFLDCENLTEIKLPSGLEAIGGDILSNTAYSLDSKNWDGALLYVDNYLLKGTDQIEGDVKIKDGTKLIADFTFSYNRNITSATIPASVKTIGSYAFSSCIDLSSVTLNEGLEVIGFGAFENTSISEVKVPKSVITIEGWAFADTKIETFEISENVTKIDDTTFDGCTTLKSITVDSNNKKYYSTDGILFEKSEFDFMGDTLILYPSSKEGESYTIPENIEYLGYNAFTNLVYLKELNVPAKVDLFTGFSSTGLENVNIAEAHEDYKSVDGVVYSKDGSILIYFPGGRNVEKYEIANTVKETDVNSIAGNPYMKELTFPEGIEKVSEYSVSLCENLTTINLPSSLTEISKDFVKYCTSLTTINYNGTKAQWEAFNTSITFPMFTETEGVYLYCTDGEIELIAPYKESDDFTLPTEEPTEGDTGTTPPEFTEPSEPEVTGTTSTDPSEPEVTGTTATEPSESVPAQTTASTPAQTTPSESATASAPADSEFELGDANMDKKLNIRDATLIQKHLAKITTMSEEAMKLADFNQDSKVNVKDATSIQKFIAGIR